MTTTDLYISNHSGVYKFICSSGSSTASARNENLLAHAQSAIEYHETIIPTLKLRMEQIEKYGPERIIEAMVVIKQIPARANEIDRIIYEAWRE